MKRCAPLKRGTRLRTRNPKRAAKSYARNYGDRGAAVRAMPCLCAASDGRRCAGNIEAAHATARGMGGCNSSRRDLVPLCTHHHQRQHQLTPTDFAGSYGVDLKNEARRIAGELDERGVP